MAEKEELMEIEIDGKKMRVKVPKGLPLPLWEKTTVVGKRVNRYDGFEKVTGRAKYAYDIHPEGMLYGRLLTSPYPRAKIVSIDTSKAEALPGVRAVITHKDAPGIKVGSPRFGFMELFPETPGHVGAMVAAVAAVNEHIAEDALELIDVKYEPLPWVLEPEKAMKPDAPKLMPSGNVIGFTFPPLGPPKFGEPWVYTRGDIDKGFAEADVILEGTYTTDPQQHACLEWHGSVAWWEGDKLIIWRSTQRCHEDQLDIAMALKMPQSKIRVIAPYMGGGFGSKSTPDPYDAVVAALLAKKAGAPVKLFLTRKEDYVSPFYRPGTIQHIKMGAKKDGTLTAIYLKTIDQIGAYPMQLIWGGCGAPARELHKCPNVKTEEYVILTNTPHPNPMRGPNFTQGTWALEIALDELAEKLNMDPLELRMKNYAELDQVSGKPYASKGLKECMELAAKEFGWEKRRRAGADKGPKKRGMGMAAHIWLGGGFGIGRAVVKMNFDGSVNLLTGAADLGTGTKTVMAQIVAEELGIPFETVKVTNADTEFTPFTLGSYGSKTVSDDGDSVRKAAADLKRQILEVAAGLFKVKAEELDIKEGKVFVKADPAKAKPIREVAMAMPHLSMVGQGDRTPFPPEVLRTFGAQFAEVEVDVETGEVKVLRIVASHDSGRVINPKLWESQVHGGVIQGTGYALFERRIIDRNTGIPVNANFEEYKIPTALDVPDEIKPVNPNVFYPANTINAKGVGEPPIVPTAPAIANAIYNATGIRVRSNPITPDKLLRPKKA